MRTTPRFAKPPAPLGPLARMVCEPQAGCCKKCGRKMGPRRGSPRPDVDSPAYCGFCFGRVLAAVRRAAHARYLWTFGKRGLARRGD